MIEYTALTVENQVRAYVNATGLYGSSDIYKTHNRRAQIARLGANLRDRRITMKINARTVHGRGQA